MSRRTHHATDTTIDVRQRQRRKAQAARRAGGEHRHDDRVPRLAVVRPVAKTALTPGTVVWAHIPYHDNGGYKLRPAVVSHLCGRTVTLLRGTSAATRHRYPWDYHEITDLTRAGLQRATGIHRKPITVDVIDILDVGGALAPEDHSAILATVNGDHRTLSERAA